MGIRVKERRVALNPETTELQSAQYSSHNRRGEEERKGRGANAAAKLIAA